MQRRALLADVLSQGNAGSKPHSKLCNDVMELIVKGAASEKYYALLNELMMGPMRYGTFLRPSVVQRPEEYKEKMKGKEPERVDVIFDNGENASVLLPEYIEAKSLALGDTVITDKGSNTVLSVSRAMTAIGDETILERIIGTDRVLIEQTKGGGRKAVYRVTDDLEKRIRAKGVRPGDSVIVCHKRQMAFDVIPAPVEEAKRKYLSTDSVPDVVVSRDIGNPPKFIEELAEWVRVEMTAPQLRRKYRLRRCATRLLEGVSGSGKTLSVLGLWRRVYDEMAKVCGVKVDELPHRVFKLRAAEVLSKWYGESDANLDTFFREVEEAAREEFTYKGERYQLPVIAVMEEIDGLTAERGSSFDGVADRLLTTLLQRLDTTRREVADSLILFIATTNVASQVDPAVLRRIGAKVERFGRLDRRSFVAVAEKVLRGRPIKESSTNKFAALSAERVFGMSGAAVAVVRFARGGPVEKRRCDFLTAAVVDAAAESAAEVAMNEERRGGEGGISVDRFVKEIDGQVGAIVGRLDARNVANYVDVPNGMSVVSVETRRA